MASISIVLPLAKDSLSGTLDPATGDPVSISESKAGAHVAVIIAHRARFPVGKGALDPAVFPEVEQAMGADASRDSNMTRVGSICCLWIGNLATSD